MEAMPSGTSSNRMPETTTDQRASRAGRGVARVAAGWVAARAWVEVPGEVLSAPEARVDGGDQQLRTETNIHIEVS